MRKEKTADTSRRRSLRVMETAYIQYEVIGEQEFAAGLERRRLRLGRSQGLHSLLLDLDTRIDEQLFLITSNSKQIGDCLSLLNDKINLVIQHIPETRESKSSLAQAEPFDCEIGADGMAFCAAEPLEPGTKLALRFLLESDSRYIETFCEVVRIPELAIGSTADRPHAVAVQFRGMKPALKEVLIQHLFHRESETLRLRRMELDAMG